MIVDYGLIGNMLFFDIETVAEYPTYSTLPPLQKELWDRISKRYFSEDDISKVSIEQKESCYVTYSGLFPEFSKVVSISYGIVKINIADPNASVNELRPIIADDEKTILLNFATVLNVAYSKNIDRFLAGHNIAAFDIPFVIKRMIKHGIQVPTILINVIKAKPWEQKVYDTIREWKFGSTEFVSLENICVFLNIETPKSGVVNGRTLNQYYYGEGDKNEILSNISKYNTADVLAVIKVVLHLAKY